MVKVLFLFLGVIEVKGSYHSLRSFGKLRDNSLIVWVPCWCNFFSRNDVRRPKGIENRWPKGKAKPIRETTFAGRLVNLLSRIREFEIHSCFLELTRTIGIGRLKPPLKPIAARPEGAEAPSPGQRPGFWWVSLAPCKGKSFTYRKEFSFFIRCILKFDYVNFKAWLGVF